jgi:hypothetical protein
MMAMSLLVWTALRHRVPNVWAVEDQTKRPST